MKSVFYIGMIGVLLGQMVSCSDDFLDVTPKGETLPETIEDYDLLFNYLSLTDLMPSVLQYAEDDSYITSGAEVIGDRENAYFWNHNLDTDPESNPQVWQPLYLGQYYANVVIQEVMKVQEGTEAEKRSLMGQAMTIRAMNYLYLLTAFANAYHPDINPDDLGVPLVTSINVTDKIPARSTLKECFDLMTSDLKQAMEWLPEVHSNRWRVTRYVAAGVLARVYTYTGQYEEANTYATIALESPQIDKILDYNAMEPADFPSEDVNSERLWVDKTNSNYSSSFYSYDLLEYFQDGDSRIRLFTLPDEDTGIVVREEDVRSFGLSYPEMYLIQAEYRARNGEIDAAMEIINTLREFRIPEGTPGRALTATNAEEALEVVLAERRRELVFRGTRWMDMKRLDLEGRMPAVHRYMNNDPSDQLIQTLEPGSPNYTFEIPEKVLSMNPDMEPNHR
ncbi:RagB/SusD family nutrient uptake outer membrane protein [Sinomicrobium sp.]